MDREPRVRELAEQALDADLSAEEVCRDHPDLIEGVRQQLRNVRRLQADLDVNLAPASTTTRAGETSPMAPKGPLPPVPGYELLEKLGEGGMGIVFRARQTKLNRIVALKMIRSGLFAGEADRIRFRTEAHAVARLQHANIVQIYDIGECDNVSFLSFEFCAGGNLADKLQGRPLPPREAARLIEILARAMQLAHDRQIVHRDLKPANILLTETEEPKIADFGLAKELDIAGMTCTGDIMGTPQYMAPEQAEGLAHSITPRTDVYALGAILYELLTGRPPFQGNRIEVLRGVVSRDPIPPARLQRQVPRDMETICLKSLAKDPALRYSSALLLAQDLELFLADEPIRGRRERIVPRMWRKTRRKPAMAVVMLALLAMTVAAGLLDLSRRHNRKAADLVQRIEQDLQHPRLAEEYLTTTEHRIDELDRLAPDKASSARKELRQRFADAIRERFRDRLEPQEVGTLEQAVAWLRSRDASSADEVDRELHQRLTRWEPRLHVDGSTKELDKIFYASETIEPTGGVLERRKSLSTGKTVGPYQGLTKELSGNVKLSATFDSSWAQGAQLGIMIQHSGKLDYIFLLTVPEAFHFIGEWEPLQPLRATFGDIRKRHGNVVASIIRGNRALVIKSISADELFASRPEDGTLRFEAKQEGDLLSAQFNRGEPILFHDPIPLSQAQSMHLALYWPGGVGIKEIGADSRAAPAVISELEAADASFNRGNFEQALASYQQFVFKADDERKRQEVQYKEGLCLLALKREDDALQAFQKLAAQANPPDLLPGQPRWPALADCQAMLLYDRQKTPAGQEAANALLEKLCLKPEIHPGELSMFMPSADCDSFLANRRLAGTRLMLLQPEEVVRENLLASRVAMLFEESAQSRFWTKMSLIDGYNYAGRTRDAMATVAELLQDYRDDCRNDGSLAGFALDQYCWCLRRSGNAEDARTGLRLLDSWLFASGGEIVNDRQGPVYFLLLERARLHVALKDWQQAEKDLDRFFQEEQRSGPRGYGYHAAACLMQGFLEERRGDAVAAKKAWERGLLRSWPSTNERDVGLLRDESAVHISFVYNLMLGSLTDSMTDREAEEALNGLLTTAMSSGGKFGSLSRVLPMISPPARSLRLIWQDSRGREWARKIAFRDLSYAEYVRTPFYLVALQIVRQGALPQSPSREQDDLAWNLARDMFEAFSARKITNGQFIALGFAWKGISLPGLGWDAADNASLKEQPALRGPLAYVVGLRAVRQNRPGDARPLFVIARDALPGNTPLRKLAQAEIDRLPAK
jgi:serine/threonine protein kinase/tetratricopeptide (TPR) repeat protein